MTSIVKDAICYNNALLKHQTGTIRFLQSVDGKRDENLTRKTCNKYFKSLPVAKMENADLRFDVKNFIYIFILFIGNTEWKAKYTNM